MIKRIVLTLFIVTTGVSLHAQLKHNLRGQVSFSNYYDKTVIDEMFGIELYEPLNALLSADSVRMCDSYLCSGWVEDKYKDSSLLHKGYYIDGQLQSYKNYYPDGTLERDFRALDSYRCMVKLYYPNGQLKSEVRYVNAFAQEWTDYYENGQIKFVEKYHRSLSYHVEKASYYESGKTKDEMLLESKKKLSYKQNEYYENGKLKSSGNMVFNESSYNYERVGSWTFYNESGKKTKVQTWDEGNMTDEKTF